MRASEVRYRRLFECAKDGILILDADSGDIMDVNPFLVEMLAYGHEEFLGKKLWEIGAFKDVAASRQAYEALQRDQYIRYEHLPLQTKDGRRVEVEFVSNGYQVEGRNVIQCNIRDVTERKRTEQQILDAVAYAQSIVETVREPLVILGQNLRVKTASRAFYQAFKVIPEETEHQLLYNLGNGQWDIPRLRTLLEEILPQDNQFNDFEVEHTFEGIGHRIMLLNARRIHLKDDQSEFILLAIEDITERRRVEVQLTVARQVVEAASRAKSEFLANMSHELRTPLNAIIGFSEVLQDQVFGPLNPKQTHYVDNVLVAGQHLLSLINDILDLSKIEAGKTTIEPTEFAVMPVLTNALVLVKERAMKHALSLHLEVSDGLMAFADERMFKQTIFNLLSNAVKFTPAGGSITIKAERVNDSLAVSVADTGIGIKLEDQTRLFTEFEQLDSGYDRMHQGTGLGLALTRKFVELHGGRIWVESPGEGRGSTFRFVLPPHEEIHAAGLVAGASA